MAFGNSPNPLLIPNIIQAPLDMMANLGLFSHQEFVV